MRILKWSLCICYLSSVLTELPTVDMCTPIVLGHRGACGYMPENTLASFEMAIRMGADYIDFDLVRTKDGHLVCSHSNVITSSTDVALHPEFASRNRTKVINRQKYTGWFTEDFTLQELKTLRVVESMPLVRPCNKRFDGVFTIPTFEEIIDLVKKMQVTLRRKVGLAVEIKHSTYFKLTMGVPTLERLVVNTLHKNGYRGTSAPVYIQSLEINNLRELRDVTDLNLLQLFYPDNSFVPQDQWTLGTGITYKDMASAEGLRQIASYAATVGISKENIVLRSYESGNVSFITNAHAVGLLVFVYTFRAENVFLTRNFTGNGIDLTDVGDLTGELKAFLKTGIDGVFIDYPDVAIRLRGPC